MHNSSTTTRRPSADLVDLVAPLVLVAVAVARLRAPLWRDEWATAMFAQLSWPALAEAVQRVDAVFAVYYGLLHPFAGLPPGFPRVISLVAMALATWRVACILRPVAGALPAAVAAISFALNPICLQAATTARSYALAVLLTVVATELLLRRCTPWAGYTAACVALPFMHPFAIALALPHLVVRALVRRPLRPVVAVWALAAATCSPLLWLSSRQGLQVRWVQPLGLRQVLEQSSHALGGTSGDALVRVLFVAGLCAALLVVATVRRQADPVWAAAVLLVLTPPAALAALSAAGRPSFVDRYLVSVPVGAALLLGLCLARVGSRWRPAGLLGSVLAVGLALAGLRGLPSTTRSIEGHPAVGRLLADRLRPGDLVVVHQGESQTGLVHGYAAGIGDDAWRRDSLDALVRGQQPYVVRTVESVEGDVVRTRAGAPRHGTTAWLVQTYGPQRIPATITPSCRASTAERVGESSVIRFDC